MGAFTTVGFSIGAIGVFIVIFASVKRQRFRAILAQGQKIYFDAEPRKILEVITYDFNKQTGKIALLLNDPAQWGHLYKTGFIYSPSDFDPNLLNLDWRSYFGIIKCYKNEEGEGDGREISIKDAHSVISKLRAENKILKKVGVQKTKEYELESVAEERKKETFHQAGVLRDLKKLTHDPEIINKAEGDNFKKFLNQ